MIEMKSNILIINRFYYFNNWIANISLFLVYIHKHFYICFNKWKRSPTLIYIFRFINSCIDQNGRIHVTRPLVLYVCFVDCCFSFCTFSVGHCVVCSSIYGFRLPLKMRCVIFLNRNMNTVNRDILAVILFWFIWCLSWKCQN